MLRKSHRTSLTLRTAVLVLAVLQVGASAVVPAIDAVLEAEPLTAPVHVESPGNEDCAAHHDHLFCQVVRSLSSMSRASSPTSVHFVAHPALVLTLDQRATDPLRTALLPGASTPRAPPLV